MIKFIFNKILYGALVLYGVLTLVFFLFNVLPADPSRMMLDKREDSDQLEVIKKKYGFDRSILSQYCLYINDLSPISIHHNSNEAFTSLFSGKYKFLRLFSVVDYTFVLKFPHLRESFLRSKTPVSKILATTFKNTFVLAFTSIIIALILGITLGVFSALYKGHLIDKFILFVSALGMSLPSFFASILVSWLFGFLLHKYTGLDMTGSLYEVDNYGRGSFIQIKNLILPSLTLSIRPLSVIIQLCRNSMLDVLSMEYVRTATAKGLSKFTVIYKHALRNSLNPLVTAISGWFSSLLAGAVFVEYIFAWNGIGKEVVLALEKMDLPVIMGSVLLIASIFVIINIIVDLIYGWLDPRVKLS